MSLFLYVLQGPFDFVQCTGVLHHLADPSQGLALLGDSLRVGGGMALMVYSKIGRTGLYQIQQLLRYVNEEENNM